MREIPLSNRNDRHAQVSEEDYSSLAYWTWRAVEGSRPGELYAVRSRTKDEAEGPRNILMHQEVMGFPGCIVDHINGDGLDNQRENLRLAPGSQDNPRNRRKVLGKTTSKYIGVSWVKARGKWRAMIRDASGKQTHIGYYFEEDQAARGYDAIAKVRDGTFAKLNFPDNAAG